MTSSNKRDLPNIIWEWTDEGAMRPLPRYNRLCDEILVVHERYRMEVIDDASWLSRKHQFAWLHEAWLSLPEHVAARFRNEEQLRKHALIKGGFCDSASIACSSKAEAERWFTVLTADDPYCIVKIEGNTLIRFKARSQSERAMGSREFQRSKQAVLDYVSSLLEVDPADIKKHAGRAA